MARIRENLAAGRPEHTTSGGAASRGVRRRVEQSLSRGSVEEAVKDLDEDDPEPGGGFEDYPDDGDEAREERDDDDPDAPDLPDVSELDSKGGNLTRPRNAPVLLPDLQPRMVEKVIRDPRLAAKLKAKEASAIPEPNMRKGDGWGREVQQPAPRAATSKRGLILEDKERRALEVVLDVPLSDAGDLMRAVMKLSTVKVGGFSVELNQAEREEVARRAAFNGRTPEQEWAVCFEVIKPLVFNAMVMQAGVRDGLSGKQVG